jgi:hypothetical protein
MTALHVNHIAQVYREKMRLQLVEPSGQRCLPIFQDLRVDAFRLISYLGITASYVDSNFQLRSVELCCLPCRELNKCIESIIAGSVWNIVSWYNVCHLGIANCSLFLSLSPFGLNNFHLLTFVSDRGSTLVKALKPFSKFSVWRTDWTISSSTLSTRQLWSRRAQPISFNSAWTRQDRGKSFIIVARRNEYVSNIVVFGTASSFSTGHNCIDWKNFQWWTQVSTERRPNLLGSQADTSLFVRSVLLNSEILWTDSVRSALLCTAHLGAFSMEINDCLSSM